MVEDYRTSLLEGVCGSIISEARIRVPLSSVKGSHALPMDFSVPKVYDQSFDDLRDCSNFKEIIFEWIKLSEMLNDCWAPLFNNHHKSLCISTVGISLPVHDNRAPQDMFNNAERDCTVCTAIDFTIDLCASHSVISVETLSRITNDHGSRICVFQDPGYDRPKIAMNYPTDCSAQLCTYHCRLFVAAHGSGTFELVDFFVIPGAVNTISATSYAGMRIYEACFPRAADANTEVDSEMDQGDEVDHTSEVLDVLNYSSELLAVNGPGNGETIDLFDENMYSGNGNKHNHVKHHRNIRYQGIIPKGINRWRSPSIPSISHYMMIWSYDTKFGKFYGEAEEYCYDNATSIPIIPASLALKYGLPFKRTDEAIIMSMGFEGMKYMARNFCIAHISLHGSKEARVVPMLISDALDLKVILIPITLANSDMVTKYLNGHLSESEDISIESPLARQICRYQPFSYSSSIDED